MLARRPRPDARLALTAALGAVLATGLAGCGRSSADATEEAFEQPPLGITSAQLVVATPADAVRVVSEPIASLYHVEVAHGDAVTADVRVDPSTQTATIRTVPSGSGGSTSVASIEVVLNERVPWTVRIDSPVRNLDLQLERLQLLGLTVGGDGDSLVARLPVPTATLPVNVAGSVPTVTLTLQYAPVMLRLDGGATELNFLHTEERTVAPGATRTGDGDFGTALTRYDVRLAHTADTVILDHD